MTNADAVSILRDYRALQVLKKQTEDQLEEMKKALQCYMDERGSYEIEGDDVRATWHEVESSRLDTSALKKAMPEVYSSFCKSSVSRVFRVQ